MKRLGLLILLAAVAAGAVVYTIHRPQPTSPANVTALLPQQAIALAHFPNFKRTRDEWHQSDLYKLYQESAVHDFLNRPLSKIPQQDVAAETASDFERLDVKDAFVAITSVENNNPHFAGGFRFRGNQTDADKIIAKWRSRIVGNAVQHESEDYQQHKVDIVGSAPNQIATVYDGQWFFASNDLTELKEVLDRVDGRDKNARTTLQSDQTFLAAMRRMPASYALLFYLQPKRLSQNLASVRNAMGVTGDQTSMIEQVESICAAPRFEKGKIRNSLFVAMPKLRSTETLTRSSLSLGTTDTFFYLATLLNPDRLAGINQVGLPLASWLQKVFDATARAGVTPDDWKAAFDLELGSLGDWPQTAHWPSIITMLRVKDPVQANKIVSVLTRMIDRDVPWKRAEKDSVAYFYMQMPAAFLAITPTIALSNRLMVVGLDSVSVEAAIDRSRKSSSGLANSSVYKSAERVLPPPTTAFVYIDTAMLYSRLDAALRPMLLMSAAFMPAISDYIDVRQLPPPEIVTKHLSPIVSSQYYDRDGYITESTGPLTLDLGLALPALVWALSRESGH
jgi:hypothetical protein